MIRIDTVFVVGAGASVPYGMPTGGELLQTAQALDQQRLTLRLANRFSSDRVEPLWEALADCQDSSIDALLEHRSDLDVEGRTLIASLLLEFERLGDSRYQGTAHDWFRYLWDEMTRDARDVGAFATNHVAFITYNYDRLLEYKMLGGLRARYRATADQVHEVLQAIPILHLHGSLGSLPELTSQGGVPFGLDVRNKPPFAEAIAAHLDVATKSVRIVHQANPENEVFAHARRLLAAAHQVFFLGFGFGSTNTRRIHLRSLRTNIPVVCGAFGLTPSEQAELIREPFLDEQRYCPHDLRIGAPDWDSRRVIRENLALLRRSQPA